MLIFRSLVDNFIVYAKALRQITDRIDNLLLLYFLGTKLYCLGAMWAALILARLPVGQ